MSWWSSYTFQKVSDTETRSGGDAILKNIATSMNQKSGKQKDDEANECERFGQYVSKSLDKLDGKSRSICKNMIQNAVFQCEMGVPQSQISQQISASPPSSLHLSW